MMNNKKTIKVVAAFMEKDGRFFAAERAYGFLKGKWEFPGGKVEPGETPREGLRREILEELDTDVSVGDFVCNIVHEYPEFILDMDVFRCTPISGRLDVHEGIHLDERYFSLNECRESDWCPADWKVLSEVAKLYGEAL